jgi:hypothetical protein
MSRLAAAAFAVLLGAASAVQAASTVCDTDPNRVLFTPTVDPNQINKLLARLGDKQVTPKSSDLTIPGLCIDYQIPLSTGVTTLPFGSSTFSVTPSLGSIRVDLDLPGPYEVGIDGGRFRAVNCDSDCVLSVPYLGELLNGCDFEAAIVRPIFGAFNANASWDDIHATQIADTCVLGDCKAVNPLSSSSVNLTNFDVDLTGFGSCQFCLPDPISLCFDPCDGLDPIISPLVEGVLEDTVNGAIVKRDGSGLLINVFARQIVKDGGCMDIPEVKDCKANQPVAGAIRTPRDHGLNALFYSLPIGLASVLALRLRRRSGSKVPPA